MMGERGVKRSAFLIGTRDRKGPGGHAEQPGHLQPQQLRSLAVLPPALRMGTGTKHHSTAVPRRRTGAMGLILIP